MSNVYQKYLSLCKAVKAKEEVTYGVNEIEAELLEVLNFIKCNRDDHDNMKSFMIKIIEGKALYPLEIVIFCMRELQWKEVKKAAVSEIGKTDDWRIISAMNNVLAVYKSEWDDADMYQYYSNEGDSFHQN
jgi:hypothetical protein